MSKWIGKWYEISAAKGNSDTVPFYFVDSQNKISNYSFPHREKDAVSRISELLNRPPAEKIIPAPSCLEKIYYGLKGILRPSKPQPFKWLQFNRDEVKTDTMINWLKFDQTALQELDLYCKQQKISMNSLLLPMLTKIIQAELCEDLNHSEGSWLFPVNMRGWTGKGQPMGNWASFITLNVGSQTTSKSLHEQTKAQLLKGEHWSNWYSYHIGLLVGHKGMKYFFKRASEKSFWLGSFSDLGVYEGEINSEFEKTGSFVFCPPGSINFPISSGSCVWNGQKSLSLKIHPAISIKRDCAKIILDTFALEISKTFLKNGKLSVF